MDSIKEIYCNYNEIDSKPTQIKIFDICLTLNLSVSYSIILLKIKIIQKLELKGNEINKGLWTKYKNSLIKKIQQVDVYSEEEDGGDAYNDEDLEDLGGDLQKLSLNKKDEDKEDVDKVNEVKEEDSEQTTEDKLEKDMENMNIDK